MDEILNQLIERLKETLMENLVPVIEEQTKKIVKGTGDLIKDFLCSFKNAHVNNTKLEQIDSLDKSKLFEIAQKYIVSGASEVAAYKTETDEEYIVYLAYTHERELLPVDDNCYVIIKSNSLGKDVSNLFGKEQLIILK
ncbi:MAG: hypothetical protein MJZ14_07835 [Paludibacteraceae bacterium]|nr:hypothetical protein [Paludibacteraceae bacterium]